MSHLKAKISYYCLTFFLQVKFVMADRTTLADLLALNLHEYEEDVKTIVDQAVKEMSMEKVLKELDATWSVMQFEKETHPRTNFTVIRASEELIETLEENQVHCNAVEYTYNRLSYNEIPVTKTGF